MPSSSVLFSCWKCFGIILLVLSFFHFFAGTGYKKLIYITSAIISKTFSAMSGNILTIFSISKIKKQEEKKRIQFPMPKNSVANWWNTGTQSWQLKNNNKKMDAGREAAVFAVEKRRKNGHVWALHSRRDFETSSNGYANGFLVKLPLFYIWMYFFFRYFSCARGSV